MLNMDRRRSCSVSASPGILDSPTLNSNGGRDADLNSAQGAMRALHLIWRFGGVFGADVNEAREGQSYNLACIVPMAPSPLLAHHGIEA